MNDLCGQQIAGYHVVRLLGRGGMAEVYEVERLGVRRAIAEHDGSVLAFLPVKTDFAENVVYITP